MYCLCRHQPKKQFLTKQTNMIKLLFVEDDEDSAYVTRGGLELIGEYDILWAKDGEEAWELFQKDNPDVVVTDIEMPRMNGLELIRRIRETGQTTIIIIESGKTYPKNVVDGFDSGADNYIKKPFLAEELHAQIQAIFRRTLYRTMDSSSQIITSDCIKIGLYRFFFLEEVLELNSGKIKLTAREAGILKMLCDKRNSTVPREEILTAFWDETDYFTSRSLDVFISKLRKYLSKDKSIQIINERGKGLRLETV